MRGKDKRGNEAAGSRHTAPGRGLFGLLAAAVLLLGGCDMLSLFDLFDTENPGKLSISPSTAVLQTGQTVTLKVFGGFGGYSFDTSGVVDGSYDEGTGVYAPPPSVVTEPLLESVAVRDDLGNWATATLKVFNAVTAPLAVAPTSWTTLAGQSKDFAISGGLGPYRCGVDDGILQSVPGSTVTISTAGWAVGEHRMEIVDAMETLVIVPITVVSSATLVVDPVSVTLGSGETVEFTAFGTVGPLLFSESGAGSFITDPTASPVTYQAPIIAADSATEETITLSDDLGSVTATVYVVNAPALVISPAYTELLTGETLLLTAGGSVPGAEYIFTLAAGKGTVEKTGPATALYTAPPTLPSRDQVCLTDDVGSEPVYAVIKVSKP